MKKRQNINTRVLLIAGILVFVNVLSYSVFFRLDFTRDKRYTLSNATLNILKNLKKTVTVTAYFSENMPPAISQARADFKDMLVEYAARSGNKVVYNFIDPSKNDTIGGAAERAGINPVMISVREKDEMKQQKAYLGAVVKMGEKTEVIPFVQPGSAMEYALTTTIKKLSIEKKQPVIFLQGNGEPSIRLMQQAQQSLDVLYDFQTFSLGDNVPIPLEYKTLTIVDPKDTFRLGQLKQLDDFLARGGRLLITYSGLDANLQTGMGSATNIGLRKWLADKNIVIGSKFIIDAHCGAITVRSHESAFNYNMPFPYLPMIKNYANHPITKQLSSILMAFTTDLNFSGDTNKTKFTPLAFTSDKTGLMAPPVTFDVEHQWQPSEFPLSNLCVAGAFTGINGNKDARIVVITNSNFEVNLMGQNQQMQKVDQDNVDLFVNAVDWLTDDTGLIELRGKEVKSVPLKDIQDSTKTLLKYLNFLLPLLIVIVYGIARMQARRSKRKKRMEEVYE
jgi:gliding-associated putative ABC transporter substrate-binding component GldG